MGAPGGDLVGSAYVDINVDASAGAAELDKLMAKADRDFAELGRKKAEVELTAKTADFDEKIDAAKEKLDYFKSRRASATLELAKSHFDEEVASAEAELKALGKQKVKIQIDAKQLRAANAEQRLFSKGRELDEKAALDQSRAESKLSTERARGTLEAARSRAEIAKLGDEYERLRGKQQAIEKSNARVFSPKSVGTAENERRALERVTAEADHVKAKIEDLGGSVEGLDARMSQNSSLLDRWLSRLGDTSVRIGPLTTSIKGLATGLGLLGPLIFELGGGAADLIGFLGSGIAGAAAVGGAGLAGFATSAVGVGLVIKPLVKEFGEVKGAEEALTKAELKYGKGSKQVKTAQEQLNHELKGVSPIAKAAIQDYGKLGGEWANLTKAAKPAVFDAFGQGLKTVEALLPEFAHESVATTKAAAGAWTAWMKSLRSSGAKQILGEVMSNFRASIPGLASGLSDIAAMLGHIAAAASHFLPGLSHGFAEWASNLEESVGSGESLVSKIGGMVKNMRDFGHLAEASGGFLVHFFGDAASSGDKLNNSLTGVIKSWDKGIQTPKGKESLTKYFEESATATEDFFAILGGAVKLLFEFSQATAPIANGLLHIVTFIGNLVNAADKLVGIKQILQGIGYAIAALYVGNKVANVVSSIGALATKLGIIGGAEDAATASIDANTVALEANTAAAAENAGASGADAAAKGLEGVAVAGDDAAVALGGAGDAAAGMSALLAPEVLIPAGVIGGLVLLSTQVEGVGSSFEIAQQAGTAAQEAWSAQGKKTAQSFAGVNDAYHKREKATNELHDAEDKTLKAIEKHGATSKEAVAATKKQENAERAQINTQKAAYAAAQNNVRQAKEELNVAGKTIKAREEEVHAAQGKVGAHAAGRAGMVPGVPSSNEAANVAGAISKLTAAEHAAAEASREMAVANIVNERSSKNLAPISDKTAASLQNLSKSIGVAATKRIGNFVNPGDVAKVANLSTHLDKLGQGAAVKTIDVKSQGAQQTTAQLERLNKQSEKVSGGVTKLTVKSNDTQANQSLRKVSQQAQAIMGARPVLKILGDASNANQAVSALVKHATAAVTKTYKAELKAEDKSGAAAANFHHDLEGVASKKYNAQLGAIDKATAPIRGAEGKANKFGALHPHAVLSATDNASAVIEGVRTKLAALNGQVARTEIVNTTKNVVTTEHKGHATGGPMFAGGGNDTLLAAQQQRAAEKATTVLAGTSRRVTQPTYLVGEQSPTHPEYVLAMNPAYRGQNERYLEDAANHMGKEVVPAYAKGKGAAPSNAGAHKPSGWGARRAKYFIKHDKYAPSAVATINQEEKHLEVLEHEYNAEKSKEEQQHEHNPNYKYNYGWFVSKLQAKHQANAQIITADGAVENDATAAIKSATDVFGPKGSRSPKVLEEQAHAAKVASEAYENYSVTPPQTKGETSKEYAKKKVETHKARAAKKASLLAAKNAEAKKLTKYKAEAKNAETIAKEASTELGEVRHQAAEVAISNEENATEQGQVNYEEAQSPIVAAQEQKEAAEQIASERGHPNLEPAELALIEAENRQLGGAELKPYKERLLEAAESELAYARTTTGISDDLEAAQEVRTAQEGLKESATNAAAEAATTNLARQQLFEQFASNISETPAYLPGSAAGQNALEASAAPQTSAATGSIQVVNNYAAPPPDPHTYSKNLAFELNAL